MDCLMTIAHFVFHFMKASNISKSRGSGELILTPVLGQWSVWLQLVHISSPRGCSSELYPATRRELESIRWTSGVLLELLMKTGLQEGSIEFTGALGSMLIPPWWRGRNKDGGGEGTNIIIRFQISSEWMGDVSLNHKIHFVPWACLELGLTFLQKKIIWAVWWLVSYVPSEVGFPHLSNEHIGCWVTFQSLAWSSLWETNQSVSSDKKGRKRSEGKFFEDFTFGMVVEVGHS